jgi:hypothetical protein
MDESTIALITSVGSFIGLVLLRQQIVQEKKTATADLVLRIYELLGNHKRIIEAVKNPQWKPDNTATNSEIDEGALRTYMGLFEGIYNLSESGLMKLQMFERLYGIRVRQIILNDYAFEILKKQPYGWKDFIQLCKELATLKKGQGVGKGSAATEVGTSSPKTNEARWNKFIGRAAILQLEVETLADFRREEL